eukprot:Rmarinus@m.12108
MTTITRSHSTDGLTKLISDLRNKSEDVRLRAGKNLRGYVEEEARAMSGEEFTRFMNDLNRKIFDLVHSSEAHDRMGGLIAIDELIDLDCEENATKITRFANYLRMILPNAHDRATLERASRALGHLARAGGTLTADFVEFEVKRSLEWLQGDRYELRRLAAVLVLKELAENSPTLFYTHTQSFFDHIWYALYDTKVVIREGAVDALHACLALLAQRSTNLQKDCYMKLYEEAFKGFAQNSADTIHGSLLALGELVQFAQGDYVEIRFKELCDAVLRFKDHRDRLIRRTVITLLPHIAQFSPNNFVRMYLTSCVNHLLSAVRTAGGDRGAAFIALGELARVAGDEINPHVDGILSAIKEGITAKRNRPFSNEALPCLSMLAGAVGSSMAPQVSTMLDQMFSQGLSAPLTAALADLGKILPTLLPAIQERLLDMLSVILARSPYRHIASTSGAGASSSSAAASSSTATASETLHDPVMIKLALQTVGSFDFQGHALAGFVRESVVWYLDDDDASIRREAALTCCAIMKRATCVAPRRGHTAMVVADVLDKLLVVAITDPDSELRQTIMASLDSHFDYHLAQAENLRMLFIALNDECFDVRKQAIQIIGRLTLRNPAYVMPALRKTLIQLLTELEYCGDSRNKEESALLLGLLIRSSDQLIKPYVQPILHSLISKLKQASSSSQLPPGSIPPPPPPPPPPAPRGSTPGTQIQAHLTAPVLVATTSPAVATAILSAIGELSRVGALTMVPSLNELMPLIIRSLQDQSSLGKREVGVRTLGQLAASTGYVVLPYLRYKPLLPTLIDLLKSESTWSIRREVIRVLGVLGALDPHTHKLNQLASDAEGSRQDDSAKGAGDEAPLLGISTDREDYHPTVAVRALMKILRDSSLAAHHTMVIQAVMFIFKSLGLKCVRFLPQIVPAFLHVMRTCEPHLRDYLFQSLGELVSIVRQHIRPYLGDIFGLIREYWANPTLLIQIVTLVERLCVALGDEFRAYLPNLIPHLLNILHSDRSERRMPIVKVLHSLEMFGTNLDDYLHLVVPALVRLFEQLDAPVAVRQNALYTLARLGRCLDFTGQASRILHTLARVLDDPDVDRSLEKPAMDVLCCMVNQLGYDFAIFIAMFNKIVNRHKIRHGRYEQMVSRILKNQPLHAQGDDFFNAGSAPMDGMAGINPTSDEKLAAPDVEPVRKMHVNQDNLKKAWEASQRSTKEDWVEWMRRLSINLLQNSASPALRSCSGLAQVHHPLARELFNAAFVSCWSELYESNQELLVRALEAALSSPTIPQDILQTLLNLAEFMEHDEKPLPIDIRTLGALAENCHAFAKALHYKELEFHTSPSTTIEALIHINNQLQQPEAAIGILVYAQRHHSVELKESWYEKLQRWDEALAAYERKHQEEPLNASYALGRMRCLSALAEWERLSQLARATWQTAEGTTKKLVAPLAARAAWNLTRWDEIEEYVQMMDSQTVEGSFSRALIALHGDDYPKARNFIERTRELLDGELTALVSESYTRAYKAVVEAQQLAELEEIIEYKTVQDEERKAVLRQMWRNRLEGCQQDIEIWQHTLAIRSLVIHPQSDVGTWLKFSKLCRKSGRLQLAEKTLATLLGAEVPVGPEDELPENAHPRVAYESFKHLWASDRKQEAFERLTVFTTLLQKSISLAEGGAPNLGSTDIHSSPSQSRLPGRTVTSMMITDALVALDGAPKSLEGLKAPLLSLGVGSPAGGKIRAHGTKEEAGSGTTDSAMLLARCFHRLGNWRMDMRDSVLDEEVIPAVRSALRRATEFDAGWYKAWHSWAYFNFEVVAHMEKRGAGSDSLLCYLVDAVRGFFRSIALSREKSLQDVLRLLTLWFKHGALQQVHTALVEGFSTVSIDTWLDVIPQIIARIHSPLRPVRRLIHDLLCRVGRAHPQALIYSLTVASKSQSSQRRGAAQAVLENMKNHVPKLVDQALLVSHELIRVAILWHEMWHVGLEEASRYWYGEHNAEAMLATLMPLHEKMAKGADTLRETSFQQAYGHDLEQAKQYCLKYKKTKQERELQNAWDLYYHVFRRIVKQLPQLTTLELQYVSPKLLDARDLQLAVPGTYRSGEPVVRIASFTTSLHVISSKQRPRKLTIYGSDGHEYTFLLKGHEDMRQDERVMQLFGLVNTLLASDRDTSKRDLSIRRYAVIPLSPNSGILGWVPHCDTLHALIRDYRESRKILLNVEQRLLLQMAPDYDHLTLMQKVEVFQNALNNTTGQDLHKVLWLKSRNAEVWLDRRTNFTRSLAVMSMVGYVLGLGDRHPSNLMLDRKTGKVLHIDFGDCFEVAMHREKFPEKIPFRLTRMLINAMEVSGIEGTFRLTCESVMRVLRSNKDSVMAMLEAFVYDPLINWRLLGKTVSPNRLDGTGRRLSTAGPAAEELGAANTSAAGGSGSASVGANAGVSSSNAPVETGETKEALSATVTDRTPTQTPNPEDPPALAADGTATSTKPPQPKETSEDGTKSEGENAAAPSGAKGPAVGSHLSRTPSVTPSIRERELLEADGDGAPTEFLNERAIQVMNRVNEKMTGKDFGNAEALDVPSQVQRLVLQATSHENLCQCYIGWCPFW